MDWFADETFWGDLKPFIFSSRVRALASAEVDFVLRASGIQRGHVLDLCCGVGRHSIELSRRGFSVTAVDLNDALLQDAQCSASRDGLDLSWIRDDMRVFCRPNAFELCINMFNSFGYFVSESDNMKVLRNIYCSLSPDGALVIDTQGKEVLARQGEDIRIERENGMLLCRQSTVDPGWRSLTEHWFLWTGQKGTEYTFHHSAYSATDLQMLLTATGFSDVSFYGDFDSRPYDATANRLIAVARK
jgi:SAM-dependent methyltransferase